MRDRERGDVEIERVCFCSASLCATIVRVASTGRDSRNPRQTGTKSSAISGRRYARRFQKAPDHETPAAAGEVSGSSARTGSPSDSPIQNTIAEEVRERRTGADQRTPRPRSGRGRATPTTSATAASVRARARAPGPTGGAPVRLGCGDGGAHGLRCLQFGAFVGGHVVQAAVAAELQRADVGDDGPAVGAVPRARRRNT